MALHFELGEYGGRIAKVRRGLEDAGLDGLLMFQQESMYYLTGYDTFGFCFFQCLYLGTDGSLALLTRSADLRQAQRTSIIEDIRIWTDERGARPADQLRHMLSSLGASGKRLGIETQSYGLTHSNGKAVESALEGFCALVDANRLVDRIRAVKSPAELGFVRRAGELANAAFEAGLAETHGGADEGRILAAMQGAIFSGGGDYPANEFIIGSGPDALLCRYKAGRRVLEQNDQLTLEFAGTYRHYHAAQMHTLIIGKPRPRHEAMFAACRAAIEACETVLRPGRTAGEVFEAHAQVMDERGMGSHKLNACGYSLGARFTPSWMDPPMFYARNDWALEAGMVMFIHMILMDSETETAMCLGRTSIIIDGAPEPLSALPDAPIVR